MGFSKRHMCQWGWPLHIDGAVRQRCIHRDTTLQELDDLLSEYDMKRDLAEINRKAPQWAHKAVWNKWYMEPKAGHTLSQLRQCRGRDYAKNVTIKSGQWPTPSRHSCNFPADAKDVEQPFLTALGTPTVRTAPAQVRMLVWMILVISRWRHRVIY